MALSVTDWIHGVEEAQLSELTSIPNERKQEHRGVPHSPPPSIKPKYGTHKRRLDETDGLQAADVDMQSSRSGSPSKKRKQGHGPGSLAQSMSASGVQWSDGIPILAPVHVPQHAWSSSQTRELREIYRFADPSLEFVFTPDERMYQAVRTLMDKIPKAGAGVIPIGLKGKIEACWPLQSLMPPDHAYDAETSPAANKWAHENWPALLQVLATAKRIFESNKAEGEWTRLASDVLRLGTEQGEKDRLLSVHEVRHSDINSVHLLPIIAGKSIPCKKADLALGLSEQNPSVLEMYRRIRLCNPTLQLSQMADPGVARDALAACIEVGDTGKPYNESSLQLGIWCFAGLMKLLHLTNEMSADTNIVPLFGWTAIGLDWKLHIAVRRPEEDVQQGTIQRRRIVILGPFDSGGTGNIHQLLILLKTIEACAEWVAEVYVPIFERIAEHIVSVQP